MIMMNNRKAFTIVELITVVTIIALLLGILLPSIAMVRAKARETAQKAQFNTIEMALEAFKQDYGDYPPSKWWIPPLSAATSYCGAQKLAEALLGWDLMGFHPKTDWRADGFDASGGTTSYDPAKIRLIPITNQPETLTERKGPYLEVATANAFRNSDLFNVSNYPYVLCDVYRVRKLTIGAKTVFAGSPILYYKANTANKTIDANFAPPPPPLQLVFLNRIYDYYDNWPITSSTKLTANGPGGLKHPIDYPAGTDYRVFYGDKYIGPPYIPTATYGGSGIGYGIRDPRIANPVRPYNPDTYILISAGPDGYYGTADDIHNY
jgi:type II secretory pathway pseudopilin PulG